MVTFDSMFYVLHVQGTSLYYKQLKIIVLHGIAIFLFLKSFNDDAITYKALES